MEVDFGRSGFVSAIAAGQSMFQLVVFKLVRLPVVAVCSEKVDHYMAANRN